MSEQTIGPTPPHILEEELSDELVLYDPKQGLFVSLNATAADVWRMATGEYTLDALVAKMAGSYGVADVEIRDQVEEAVRELIEAGLLPARP
jgi:hypothetical protein